MSDELQDARDVEEVYDALEAGDAERALALVQRARSTGAEDPVLLFLAGVARLEIGEPEEAVRELRRAVELDPEDPEFRVRLATALFRACRFEEARAEARRALETDSGSAEAHEITALLLEREGRFEDADRHLKRATALDPERFPPPLRLSRREFEKQIGRCAEHLPEEFRRRLDEVVVTVEDLPSDDVLHEEEPPLDPELLGLFVGVALPERTAFSTGGEMPPRILLFQRNLERYAGDEPELREEIAVTLYHELGHYLGLDEDELEVLDLA